MPEPDSQAQMDAWYKERNERYRDAAELVAELEDEFGPIIAERARSRGFPLSSPLLTPQQAG